MQSVVPLRVNTLELFHSQYSEYFDDFPPANRNKNSVHDFGYMKQFTEH